MEKRDKNEWITYNYNLDIDNFYKLYPLLEDDMFGKLKKTITYLNQFFIKIDSIVLLCNESRQYKINKFLTKNDNEYKFKYAEIFIKSPECLYQIEFIKSKKGIISEITTKNLNTNNIKKEVLDDFKKQIKTIKNKIDKHTYSIKDIKKMIESEIEKNNIISDILKNYVFAYIEKFKIDFYNVEILIYGKNYMIIDLGLKKNDKILEIHLSFGKASSEYYCSDTYKVVKINNERRICDSKKLDTFNDAYMFLFKS